MGKGAGEKNGARKSEPAREPLIFEFLAFADERSERSDWLKLTDYRNQCKLTIFHITRNVGRLFKERSSSFRLILT